jgi:glycosyltransferase involved in cell wall biosynthesis
MNKPKLSIIIASYNSQNTIQKCLESLENQIAGEIFEVIVVDSSTDNTASLVAEKFPQVKLYKFSERKFPGDARNIGVSKAEGEILAFTDADCFVESDWVNKIIEAHQKTEHPVIGGAVDNGNPESYIGWGYYFCEFSQWIPQSQNCYLVDIPTTCLSPKRWAFEKYGPFLEGIYCSDTAFNWSLEKAGYKPLFVPSIKVAHINIEDLKDFWQRKVRHGRYFANVRVSLKNFSQWQIFLYITISPLLPFLLFCRRMMNVVSKGTYIKEFILASPLVFFGLLGWSYGEFLGYLNTSNR